MIEGVHLLASIGRVTRRTLEAICRRGDSSQEMSHSERFVTSGLDFKTRYCMLSIQKIGPNCNCHTCSCKSISKHFWTGVGVIDVNSSETERADCFLISWEANSNSYWKAQQKRVLLQLSDAVVFAREMTDHMKIEITRSRETQSSNIKSILERNVTVLSMSYLSKLL